MKKSVEERLVSKNLAETKKSFGFVNNNFINIYTKDNPILNIDDECYFLFYHPVKYHRTIIGRGKVLQQIFTDGMNVFYYIGLQEIIESDEVKNKFVYGQKFWLWKFEENKLYTERMFVISEKTSIDFLSTYLFKAESFFVRKTLEDIQLLQKEYAQITKNDLLNQLDDINEIIGTEIE